MTARPEPAQPAGAAEWGSALRPAASLLGVPLFRDRDPGPPADGPPPPAPPSPAPPREPAPAATGSATPVAAVTAVDGPPAGRPDAPAPPDPDAPAYRDLRQYWRGVARGGVADVDALDAQLIARRWPHTLLVRVPDDGLLDLVRVFAGADGTDPAAAGAHPLDGDRVSQLSSWVLRLVRGAASDRGPREVRESFEIDGRRKLYRAQLLPCAKAGDPAAFLLLGIAEA